MFRALTTLIAAAVVATPALASHRYSPDIEMQKLLSGRVAGKPVNCINLPAVTSSQIIDRRAIVYRAGGTLYVNEPRSGASSLRGDDVLVTRTVGSELCSIDTVRLIDRASQIEDGFVTLGEFVPYKKFRATN